MILKVEDYTIHYEFFDEPERKIEETDTKTIAAIGRLLKEGVVGGEIPTSSRKVNEDIASWWMIVQTLSIISKKVSL